MFHFWKNIARSHSLGLRILRPTCLQLGLERNTLEMGAYSFPSTILGFLIMIPVLS